MKYYLPKKKPLNYFERQLKKLHPKKYHYYFFDYMYYCGEKWSEKGKGSRTSGMIVLFSYWSFCIILPLCMYLSSVSIVSRTDGWHIIGLFFLCIIPPVVFYMLRYRTRRRSALMIHYRRSEWCKGIPVWLACSMWFPLCILELWVLIGMGWLST